MLPLGAVLAAATVPDSPMAGRRVRARAGRQNWAFRVAVPVSPGRLISHTGPPQQPPYPGRRRNRSASRTATAPPGARRRTGRRPGTGVQAVASRGGRHTDSVRSAPRHRTEVSAITRGSACDHRRAFGPARKHEMAQVRLRSFGAYDALRHRRVTVMSERGGDPLDRLQVLAPCGTGDKVNQRRRMPRRPGRACQRRPQQPIAQPESPQLAPSGATAGPGTLACLSVCADRLATVACACPASRRPAEEQSRAIADRRTAPEMVRALHAGHG